jgi:hypothetical protein
MSQDDFSTGTVELEDAELRFDQPPLYTVVILNDESEETCITKKGTIGR